MTRLEIAKEIAEKLGLSKVETELVINGFLDKIIDCLIKDKKLELRGFGTFYLKDYREKIVRNPKTGVKSHFASKKVPKLRFSPRVEDYINKRV
ncbi:HU family DNA-binding protein [bacterium]|nr:HU family DNA-binding protein [bacterium]